MMLDEALRFGEEACRVLDGEAMGAPPEHFGHAAAALARLRDGLASETAALQKVRDEIQEAYHDYAEHQICEVFAPWLAALDAILEARK